MPDSKTYTGGCHCGMVRFECTTDLAMVTACNCSICTKKGLHFAFLAPSSFQLRAGEDNLQEYLFNKHAIRHQLCVDCGVDVFARGSKPDGTEVVALNVSCIDGIELAKLTMTPIDGRTGSIVVIPRRAAADPESRSDDCEFPVPQVAQSRMTDVKYRAACSGGRCRPR